MHFVRLKQAAIRIEELVRSREIAVAYADVRRASARIAALVASTLLLTS